MKFVGKNSHLNFSLFLWQVSIEVVENPTMDVEMDLQREGRHDWPLTGSGWPLSGPGAEDGTRILEWWSQWQDDDDNMAGSRKGGSQVANSNWEAIAEHRHVQPAEPAIQESWGPWSACTAACGLGEERRSRSCGPSCTATETQTCQGPPCPGITSEDSIQKERFNKDNITYTAPDSCERWLSCNSTFLRSYISSAHSELPSCPCCYPAAVAYGSTQLPDTIGHPIRSQQLGREDGERRDGLWNRNGNSAWDGGNHRHLSQEGGSDLRWDNVGVRDGFRLKEVINTPGTDEPVRLFPWKDASSHKERLDVYHPTARYCIRSLVPPHAKTLAAQKCCYDEDMHLITRGPGAGIPSLVSPEFSPELHQRIDIAPWLACSGDWSRFHTARPPDNRRQCPTNPDSLRFLDLLQQAKDF
uniref:AMOP domain-containing protein n=1 Tax=Eptatretus burgeri TaxID=7764 RepID=A0A8C4NKC9_EPTBU